MTPKNFLTRLLPALLLVLLGGGLAYAQAAKVAGDWEGMTDDGRHLQLHFTAETATVLSGTLDSPDQGAFDIPLSDVSCKDGALSATVAIVQGVYRGKLSDDGKTLTGTFTMNGEAKPLNFTRMAATATPAPAVSTANPAAATGPSIDGTWKGVLEVGGVQLHLILHFTTTGSGLSATLDSPDQGAIGIPCRDVVRTGDALRFNGPAGGSFVGTIGKDGAAITGTWSQSGYELPLVLTQK